MFRAEAISAQGEKLTGDVSLAIPLAWQAISYLLFLAVVAAIVFLALASYARVETVGGTVVPDAGVAVVYPRRAGTIVSIGVREGQEVTANVPLAVIRSEEDGNRDTSVGDRVAAALAEQDRRVQERGSALQASIRSQMDQMQAQRAGLLEETASLEAQIGLQQQLITSAEHDLEQIRPVVARGFVSERDYRARQENLIARRQQRAQLSQTLSSRRASLVELDRRQAELAAQAVAQVAEIGASRAQLAQQTASADGARAYALRSPVAGRVTAMTARLGQAVDPAVPLMSVIPAKSRLRVELMVPTTAIGFVRPGQAVRLAIDAFPYQRFGVVPGRVLTVAESPVNRAVDGGAVRPVYLVAVAMERDHVMAFGQRQPLVPGMTLSARIVTEKQTLIQWLFEPLLAVQRR